MTDSKFGGGKVETKIIIHKQHILNYFGALKGIRKKEQATRNRKGQMTESEHGILKELLSPLK